MGLFNFGKNKDQKANKNLVKEEQKRIAEMKHKENLVRNQIFQKTDKFQYLYLDNTNRLFKIRREEDFFAGSITTFSFDELINYELFEDEVTVTKGGSSIGRALVGATLAGPAGLVVGGLTGSKTSRNSCDKLSVKFTVDGLHAGTYEIKLIKKQTKKKSLFYETAVKNANEIILAFDTIIASQQYHKTEKNETEQVNYSLSDELLKLKSLVESGILTQEEFEVQKNKLLNK